MSSNEHLDIAERVFGYRPTDALSIAAAVVYGIVGSALMFRTMKSKAWWALCLPIGAFFEAKGFGLRYLSKFWPNSVAVFAIEELFIVCAPASFLAFNYIVYGRLISYVGAEYSIVNPRRVALAFVISDVFTFVLQASGSALQTSDKMASTGQKITLVGLVLQAVSYGLFCLLLVKSHFNIRTSGSPLIYKACIKLIWVLYFSSAFVSIRCIYRIVEYAQGRGGYLLTHEVFLFTLDTLPLLLAIIIYIPFWPAKYLEPHHGVYKENVEMNTSLRDTSSSV